MKATAALMGLLLSAFALTAAASWLRDRHPGVGLGVTLALVALFAAYDRTTKEDDAEDWDLRPETRDPRPIQQAPIAAR